jgi:hypothetical protein
VPIARWRQVRAEATAATLARLEAENTALRQRVGELERLASSSSAASWRDRRPGDAADRAR